MQGLQHRKPLLHHNKQLAHLHQASHHCYRQHQSQLNRQQPHQNSVQEDLTYLILKRPEIDTRQQTTSGTPAKLSPAQISTIHNPIKTSQVTDRYPQEEVDIREADLERRNRVNLSHRHKKDDGLAQTIHQTDIGFIGHSATQQQSRGI